jgi:hypothetical protein
MMMGVETPIPPITMNAADGAPPRRSNNVKKNAGNLLAQPCLDKALMRGDIVNTIFIVWVQTPVQCEF